MSELYKLRELAWIVPFGKSESALLALELAGIEMTPENLPANGESIELGIVDGDLYTLHCDKESGQYYLGRKLAARSILELSR